MAYLLCVDWQDKKLCIDIPVQLKRKYPWERIELDLEKEWIVSEHLSEQIAQDITVLAGIEQLAEQLSIGKRRTLNSALAQIQEQLELPAGMTLERH